MKRTIALVLVMIFIVGLAACGETNSSEDKTKKPAGGHTQSSVVSSNDTVNSEQQNSNGMTTDINSETRSDVELPDKDTSNETPSNTTSVNNTTSDKTTSSGKNPSTPNNTSSNNTTSKDTVSKNNTSNNTSSKDTVSKNDTPSKNETSSDKTPSNNTSSNTNSSVVTEFYNISNPKFTSGKLTIHPRHVYWKDGNLVAQCFIVNGTGDSLSGVKVNRLVFTNGKGQVLADGTFSSSTISFISAIGRKLNHGENIVWNFTFSGDSVINYGADLSRIIIDASTNNYK